MATALFNQVGEPPMSVITDRYWGCPYCYDKKTDERGCCGESSSHFVHIYEIDGEENVTEGELDFFKIKNKNEYFKG